MTFFGAEPFGIVVLEAWAAGKPVVVCMCVIVAVCTCACVSVKQVLKSKRQREGEGRRKYLLVQTCVMCMTHMGPCDMYDA